MNNETPALDQTSKNLTEGLKSFACPQEGCGRCFREKFLLNRHMVIHSEKKKYICQYCQKTFSLPQYWREHVYTHTKELPYVCGISGCTLRFRQAGKLCLHRRSHPEYTLKKYSYSSNIKNKGKALTKKPGQDKEREGSQRKEIIFEVKACKAATDITLPNSSVGCKDHENLQSPNIAAKADNGNSFSNFLLPKISEMTAQTPKLDVKTKNNEAPFFLGDIETENQKEGFIPFIPFLMKDFVAKSGDLKVVLPLPLYNKKKDLGNSAVNHYLDLFSLESRYGK